MFRVIVNLAIIALLSAVINVSSAQGNNWTKQGANACSDQYGNFDAFIPGMRGHGSCNRGGFVPGTNVVVVTNTNATGPGSLDAASDVACPKVVLFGVSGLINRGGQIIFDCDRWSVVGASAPGQLTITGGTGNAVFATRASRDWTVDHLTIASGDLDIQSGSMGNRDSIAMGTRGAKSGNGIILNSNLIWGADETVQCNPPSGSESDYILFWQNIIGSPVNGSGVHILQNSCRNLASIRNFYIHSNGRHPLVRGDGYFHANNFTANPGYETVNIQTCGGSSSAPDPTTRMQFVSNLMARGNNSSNHKHISVKDGLACTDFQIFERDTHTLGNSRQIENCKNHNCVDGVSASEFTSAKIEAVYPQGYIAEPITESLQGYMEFAGKITSYAGANPTNRLPYIDTLVGQGINHVDGDGPRGGWGAPVYPAGQPLDGTLVQGGLPVITPESSSYDPTDSRDNFCGEDMPTGGSADAIQASGLTRLHEWVIGCFYDNVMPAGYREDGLENYALPDGDGPRYPTKPRPPFIQ